MAKTNQKTITMSVEDVERLEQIRMDRGLRSWPETIRSLMDEVAA